MRQISNKRIASMLSGAMMAASLSIGPLQAIQNTTTKPPDNTHTNKRDKSQSEPTADQAKNSESDRQLMARIRRDVTKDKTLSSYGHNVKIIAEQGKVTLKGPVRSEDEKRTIEEYARKYAGDGNVTNELDIKAENK